METKIPKPGAFRHLAKSGSSVSASNENLCKLQGSQKVTTYNIRPTLRRRSKSAVELRARGPRLPPIKEKSVDKPLTSKDKIEKTLRVIDKPPSTIKAGQKRPALHTKTDEENKPKVAKVKIPDWDYKSRFQELQKKHTKIQEDHKSAKLKLADLESSGEELEYLRTENKNMKQQIESLQHENTSLTSCRDTIATERTQLLQKLEHTELELKIKTDLHNNLCLEHEQIKEELKKNVEQLNDSRALCSQLSDQLEKTKAKLKEKTTSHENLVSQHSSLKEHLTQISSQAESLQDELLHFKSLTNRLKRKLEDHEDIRRQLHNTVQDMKGNIRVFCRVRPPANSEEKSRDLCSIFFPNENSLEIRKARESNVRAIASNFADLKQEFNFDKVFPPDASQEEVFEELAQLVQSALDGYHVCVFAYGQTGSGKTHTMQGSSEMPGMIPRTIDLIFTKIENLAISGWTYKVSASFLEIYNENIKDLLVPNSPGNYEVRYNEGRGVTVTNLKIVEIFTAKELKDLMNEAHKNRAVAATNFNEHSSRSHAVTKIDFVGYKESGQSKFCGSISLVDLAGSESAKTSSSDRINETKSINKSLATLGDVMMALHNKDLHVPYRNSKLTFLLQSSLGGNSKTLMFVNVAPFEECYSESIHSLRFASKVKEVKTTAKRSRIASNKNE